MKKLLILTLLFSFSAHSQVRARHQLSFNQLVSMNQIVGAEALYKFGLNGSVDVGTDEDCWIGGGTYVWPTTATVVSTVSDSLNDASGGTGARSLTIYGLDASFNRIQETITLNGTTPVVTTTVFYRVYREIVNSAGSTGSNVGIITSSINSSPVGVIAPTAGQTQQAIYTVPANYNLLIHKIFAGVGKIKATSGAIYFYIRPLGGAWNVKQVIGVEANTFERDLSFPMFVPEKTDVKMVIKNIEANGTSGICSFDGILFNGSFDGV